MMTTSIPVFRSQFLSTRSNQAAVITSQPVQMTGNRAVVSSTVINIAGTGASLACQMQGSYDGLTWETLGNATSQGAFGFDSSVQGSVDYNWIRVEATLTDTGNDSDVIFDATLAFSEQ